MSANDTSHADFDRLLAAWFDAEARVREPDDLLERTLVVTSRRRPRRAWLLPERWLPMDLPMQRIVVPRGVRYAVLLAILVIAAAVAIAIVGSRPRVPAPFGPAANGSIVVASGDADIVALDPITGETRIVVGGPEHDYNPTLSLDGTRIAFVRRISAGSMLYVVAVEGGEPRAITNEPLKAEPYDLAWSPNGRQIAWLAGSPVAGSELWIGSSEQADAAVLDVDLDVSWVDWRPPSGEELVIRGGDEGKGKAGLYLIGPDGSGLRPITALDGNQYDYIELSWSPDGERLAYSRLTGRRAHVLTVAPGEDRVIEPGRTATGTLFPKFSPDGSRLAVFAWLSDTRHQVGVVPAGGTGMILTGPEFSNGPDFVWSPDGRSILAIGWNSSDPWLLDPAGGGGRKLDWQLTGDQGVVGGENVLVDIWQRLAP